MKELADALKTILNKVSEFFDLFDLSFLVSGVTSLAAFAFWFDRTRLTFPVELRGAYLVLAIVIASYVSGLICFAAGRGVRKLFTARFTKGKFDAIIKQVLCAHRLDAVTAYESYLGERGADPTTSPPGPPPRPQGEDAWRLCVRLWAEVRQAEALDPSFSLLKRYWVMAATYDGVALALILWIAVLIACASGIGGDRLPWSWMAGVGLVLLLTALVCWREAGRYGVYQVEELAATIAVWRSGLEQQRAEREQFINRAIGIIDSIPGDVRSVAAKSEAQAAIAELLVRHACAVKGNGARARPRVGSSASGDGAAGGVGEAGSSE